MKVKMNLLVIALFIIGVSFGQAAEATPEASAEPAESAPAVPLTTPGDIGIENGQAPMILTDANGEPLSNQFQVINDGVNEKFRIAEDSTDVSITEHSVIYNTGTMQSAGMNPGDPDIQWTVTNQGTGETQNGGSGSTSYAGVFNTPGFYNLGNSGSTPVDSSTVVSSGTVDSGTDVELEVADITAPSMKVLVVPEDNHNQNTFYIREDPENLDAYPITQKTAKVTVEGNNWTKAGAQGAATDVSVDFVAPFGMVTEEDLPNVNDSKINPDIQAVNDYTVNSSLDSSLGDGLYVPVAVRTNFNVSVEDDNDPREERQAEIKKTWKLIVSKDGETEEFVETSNYIFRVPNYNVAGGPEYTLVAESIDGTGNSITCRIPIIVLPKDLDVKNLENKSERID